MVTREESYSASSYESTVNRVLTRAYTLNWEMIAYGAILVLAILTRFVDLGTRVMSHDESLHTYYSWRLYEYGDFQHTPLMHGPLLFHVTALMYFLFGDNDFTSRIYPALLGVLIAMFPILYRRWLGRVGAVITSVLLVISPMLMYYNRYIRHDTPTIFFALIVLYAILQYVDGERPRRPLWLLVMSGALLGMLASKEVSFIYIAIFGSFLALIWLLRLVQDIGVRKRPAGLTEWRAPWLQWLIGHVILIVIVGVIAVALGGFLRFAFSPILWMPSGLWIQVPLFFLMYIPLVVPDVIARFSHSRAETSSGIIEFIYRVLFGPPVYFVSLLTGVPRAGISNAIMRGLGNGRSALNIILAGILIGAILALVIVAVIDVIKPDTVWKNPTVQSQYDQTYGANGTKEYAWRTDFDETMFIRLATWIGVPVLIVLLLLFLTSAINFPSHLALPWREMLLIILVAFITTSALVMVERRSFVEESEEAPFAVDPTAQTTLDGEGQYHRLPIVASWVIGVLIMMIVVATRLLTDLWDFFNRQPLFDILIVIGTLILPWAAAFPLYWAGYNLEEYNANTQEGRDTLNAALITFIPFALVSISVGLAWNWKRWIPAAAVFLALFTFFFTTVFSYTYGFATGMIGSLGYWLEQQGVRRGSQPQYYYLLTQLPVYEFLPMIGALLAGVTGLSELWRARREQVIAARDEKTALLEASIEAEAESDGDITEALPDSETQTLVSDIRETQPIDLVQEPDLVPEPGTKSRLFRPYDPEEEAAQRITNREWIGALPFLGMVGYWAIMILLALTIAGEKMPWLTTHLTVPLILLTGWWLGRVVTGINREALRSGGWLVMLVAMPLFFVALAQVFLPVIGENAPFQGRSVEELSTSGNWLAAALILIGTLYLIGRFGGRIGIFQLGRLAIVAGAILLAILTTRAAVMASFINYDYATEFLVYAHAGPAVKTVLNEVDRIATLTNEGYDMRIVFDDESSWPFTWYFRDYNNYGYIRGEAGTVDPSSVDGAKVVVVGGKKAGDVRQILGDRYYEFGYFRLWWPMQEYFHLNYDRVANVFSTDRDNPAAEYYREGIFDIWWERDYSTYAQAMCMEDRQERCIAEAEAGETDEDKDRLRNLCHQAIANECSSETRFEVNNWPVSDRLYFFVDKEIAAQIWDAGIGSSTVNIRAPEYPEDLVYRDIEADLITGQEAAMISPRGLAVGPDGLVYIADTDHHQVVVLDAVGTLVRTLGGSVDGSAEPGMFKNPWGVDVGPDGHLYVADTWNHRIQVFNAAGELLRIWGHEGLPTRGDNTEDAFWGPRDVKIGPDGNVYVADTGNKRVRVYTPEGEFVRDIGSPGSSLGQLDEPVGLAFNPISGELYVAEPWNTRISVFDRNGQPMRTWDVNMWFNNRQSYNRPYLSVSADGTLVYVTDMDEHNRIVAYDLSGQPVLSFNKPDNLDINVLGLRSPAGMDIDSNGRLYVVDAELALVFIFPPPDVVGSVPPVLPAQIESPLDMTEVVTEETSDLITEEVTEEVTEDALDLATEEATEEALDFPTEEVTEDSGAQG